MAGETDLGSMLASLRIRRRTEPVTIVGVTGPVELGDGVVAVIAEDEGTTVVVTIAEARRRGWPIEFRAAWLTVSVHSSLAAVGLTAELAGVLAERGIACNVLAGYFHDHLLVPLDRADEAIGALEGMGGDAEAAGGSDGPESPMHLERFEASAAGTIARWARSASEARDWCSLTEVPVPPEVVVGWSGADDTEAYILVDRDRPVAYGEVWIDDVEGEVELGHLIVDPDRRGQGIGRSLTGMLVELGRARHPEVFVRVAPGNDAALRCYSSAGFEAVDDALAAIWNAEQPRSYVWLVAR